MATCPACEIVTVVHDMPASAVTSHVPSLRLRVKSPVGETGALTSFAPFRADTCAWSKARGEAGHGVPALSTGQSGPSVTVPVTTIAGDAVIEQPAARTIGHQLARRARRVAPSRGRRCRPKQDRRRNMQPTVRRDASSCQPHVLASATLLVPLDEALERRTAVASDAVRMSAQRQPHGFLKQEHQAGTTGLDRPNCHEESDRDSLRVFKPSGSSGLRCPDLGGEGGGQVPRRLPVVTPVGGSESAQLVDVDACLQHGVLVDGEPGVDERGIGLDVELTCQRGWAPWSPAASSRGQVCEVFDCRSALSANAVGAVEGHPVPLP